MPLTRAIAGAGVNLGLPVAGVWWGLEHTHPSVVFAFAVNWGLMGFAFVASLIVPLRLWPAYYRTCAFERRGRVYERLGVRAFQAALRRSRLHGPAPFPRIVPAADRLGRLATDTYAPETAHALIFVAVLVIAADALRLGWWDTAAWLLLFNLVLNAYPVFSMRHVRARIAAVRQSRAA